MNTNFDKIIKKVIKDKRCDNIPILFITQIIIILDDLGLLIDNAEDD